MQKNYIAEDYLAIFKHTVFSDSATIPKVALTDFSKAIHLFCPGTIEALLSPPCFVSFLFTWAVFLTYVVYNKPCLLFYPSNEKAFNLGFTFLLKRDHNVFNSYSSLKWRMTALCICFNELQQHLFVSVSMDNA